MNEPTHGPSYAQLREALYNLIRSHNGYRHGMGPCVCAAHEKARELLGISRAEEPPAGLQSNGDGGQ